MKSVAATYLLMLVSLFAATGCKKSDGGEKVTGHVTYKNAPLTDAAVIFYPETGRNVVASLDSAGNYYVSLRLVTIVLLLQLALVRRPAGKKATPCRHRKLSSLRSTPRA